MLYFYPITLVVSLFSSINLKYNTKAPNFTLLGVKLGACFTICWFSAFIAEREGFEPPVQLPVHRISSAARSTTPASFLLKRGLRRFYFDGAKLHILFVNLLLISKNLINKHNFFGLFDFEESKGKCNIRENVWKTRFLG